jgi:NADPH:quinone reductase-like Zn-dependent oxidoreductase
LNGALVSAIADGGYLVTLRRWSEFLECGIKVFPVSVGEGLERTDLLESLRDAVNAGVLVPRVARVLPASQAAEAHRLLEAGGVRGRLVLDFS